MHHPLRLLRPTMAIVVGLALTSNAFAQLPVTDGLLLWLDATDPSTLYEDIAMSTLAGAGDEIAVWADKSGNGYNATQFDEFARPIHEPQGINNQPSVRFQGADADGMAIDEDLYLERDYTVFIANQYYGPTRGRTLQGLDSNWLAGLWGGEYGHYAGDWVGRDAAFVDTPYVSDVTGDLDGSTFTTNGTNLTANGAPLGDPGRLGLISYGAFPAEVSDADISEILIYDRVLTEQELTDTRTFLYNKYDASELIVPQPTVLAGELGTFTGGDPGEGLDLVGDFEYALNIGGPGGYVVGDVEFEDGSELGLDNDGVFITDANEIVDWYVAGEFGDSGNDDDLEFVMESIRWNEPPGLEIDLSVESGATYEMQLLFGEQCCSRGFDIFVEGEMVVDDMNVSRVQGRIANPEQGVVYSYTFTAGDGTLNLELGGEDPTSPDNNPILNALTLKRVTSLPGDFDGNGVLDAADIDALSVAVAEGSTDLKYDVDGDGSVLGADRFMWVEDLKNTYFGDANLDGEFNSADFVFVFRAGQYEDAVVGNSTWGTGDWNGDGDFDSSDFVVAFSGGGFEQGPRQATAAVPEPGSFGLLLIGLLCIVRRSRHHA